MRIDWASMFTIFLAIMLARIVSRGLFFGSNSGSGTQVGAVVNSPAEPVTIYRSAIDQYIAENHPNARR